MMLRLHFCVHRSMKVHSESPSEEARGVYIPVNKEVKSRFFCNWGNDLQRYL